MVDSVNPKNVPNDLVLGKSNDINNNSHRPQNFTQWLSKNSIGSQWTVEISQLRRCSSSVEAITCLIKIENSLLAIARADRIRFCKSSLESTLRSIRHKISNWSNELEKFVIRIMKTYFDECKFRMLPQCIIQEIMLWMPIDEFSTVLQISQEFNDFGNTDEVWRTLYSYKFLSKNPNTIPEQKNNYKELFRQRLADPQVGDHVEVSWSGKFRLEAQEVYQGLAWWVAEVVRKQVDSNRYMIKYPGWESRWDEWVVRDRLRWSVDRNNKSKLQASDVVELWCYGSNVPGAWLETIVKRVRNGRYNVGKVSSTGSLWVERDRLRPVKRLAEFSGDTGADSSTSQRERRGRYVAHQLMSSCTLM